MQAEKVKGLYLHLTTLSSQLTVACSVMEQVHAIDASPTTPYVFSESVRKHMIRSIQKGKVRLMIGDKSILNIISGT